MPIIVQEMPSGGLFFHGELIQRKLAVKSRRHVMLCLPTTTDDISLIQAELAMQAAISKHTAVLAAEEAVEQRMRQDMEAYGHIALSAVSGYPLLVIGTNVRTFIHFSQIDALLDETELQTPCAFAVVTAFKEFKFYTNTSTDYQRWIGALTQAFANLNFNVKDDSYRPVSPESFNEAFQRHTPMAPSTLFSDYTEPEPRQSISRLSRADTPARSLDMEPIAWDSRHSGNVESINNSEQPSERAISTKSSRLFTKIKSLFKSESTKDSSQPHYYQTRYPESDENGHSRPRSRSRARSRSALGHRQRLGFSTQGNDNDVTRTGENSLGRSERSRSRSRSVTRFFTGLVPSLRLGDSGQSFSKMVSQGTSSQHLNQPLHQQDPNIDRR